MNLYNVNVVLFCYAILVLWTLCGLLCGLGFLIRGSLRRQLAELYAETVKLHSRFVRHRKRRTDTWSEEKDRAARETHAGLVRRRQVYSLLAMPRGEWAAAKLVRAQECTEHERVTPFEHFAIAKSLGVGVSTTFEGLGGSEERKRFLDELGEFLDGWNSN